MCSDCKQLLSCYQEQPATEKAVTMMMTTITTRIQLTTTLCIDPLDAVMSNDLILCKYSTTNIYYILFFNKDMKYIHGIKKL